MHFTEGREYVVDTNEDNIQDYHLEKSPDFTMLLY